VTTRLAVIVVSYNVCDLLRACLGAALASLRWSPELDGEVWVVDNASPDGSAGMVAAEFPQVHLIANSANVGFAGGNNQALRELGFESGLLPDLVLLLNPDAELLEDAAGRMARFLFEHPAAGGAGAQLIYPDGRFQHGAFRFPGLWQLWFDFFPPRPRRLLDSRLNGRYPQSLYRGDDPFAVDFVLGASLMARREAIAAAGLMDEGYFMYAEEVDWCWRMQRAGWPFYCVPEARVIHHGGASAGQFRSRSFLNLWRSRQRLYNRFYGPVRRRLAAKIVRLGMQNEARRVLTAARRSDITAAQLAELAERVEAAQQVSDMFAGNR
jgi:N-acetylglucosaminyl-diphospho-decaprenol L-rhamnosyltransferase